MYFPKLTEMANPKSELRTLYDVVSEKVTKLDKGISFYLPTLNDSEVLFRAPGKKAITVKFVNHNYVAFIHDEEVATAKTVDEIITKLNAVTKKLQENVFEEQFAGIKMTAQLSSSQRCVMFVKIKDVGRINAVHNTAQTFTHGVKIKVSPALAKRLKDYEYDNIITLSNFKFCNVEPPKYVLLDLKDLESGF